MIELKLTLWDRKQLFNLLGAQNVAKAPLSQVADMLDVRSKLDPTELKSEDIEKKYTLKFSKSQFNQVYKIATNESIEWPINEHSAKLFKTLEEAKPQKK